MKKERIMKIEHLEFLDTLLKSSNWVSVSNIEELHKQISVNYYTAPDSVHFVDAQSKLFISINSSFSHSMLIDCSSEITTHKALWVGLDLDKRCITFSSPSFDLAFKYISLIPQCFHISYSMYGCFTIEEFKKLHGSKNEN